MKEGLVRDVQHYVDTNENWKRLPIYWPLLLLVVVLPGASAFHVFIQGSWTLARLSIFVFLAWALLLFKWNRKQRHLATREQLLRRARLHLVQTGLVLLSTFLILETIWIRTTEVSVITLVTISLLFGGLALLCMTVARPIVGLLVSRTKRGDGKARISEVMGGFLTLLAVAVIVGIPDLLAPDTIFGKIDDLILIAGGIFAVAFGSWCLSTGLQMTSMGEFVLKDCGEDT